jgi:adenosyl cobinamide kinase/adenosyl cobinamide phosphate guanylyltransferase
MTLTLLIGGARSGKSSLAVRLASQQDAPVVVVATGEPGDDEMAERIARHRAERPPEWRTVEEPRDLLGALTRVDDGACVIVDCLTLWVANVLEQGDVEAAADRTAAVAALRTGRTIAVTNEVGLGVVPAVPLARAYRDVLGRVNAAWAAVAHEVLFVVAGRVLPLDPVDG